MKHAFSLKLSLGWGVLLLASVYAQTLLAYTPDSPVVNAMVEKGIAYIESVQAKGGEGIGTDPNAEGAHMLSAYTHHKVRQNPDHPVVQKGIQTALSLARVAMSNGLPVKAEITYETSVAILLLVDVDPQKYATQIQGLANALMAVQKPHGGFGYLNEQLGDTSQTQYVVLAMWTLDQANFNVPKIAMDRAIQWLLRTQDPSGQWGYKGKDSGRIGNKVEQDSYRGHSLTTAGGGSVLIGGDFFGLWRSSKELKPEVENLPPALKEQANLEEMKAKRESFKIPAEQLMTFVGASKNWLNNNPYQRPGGRSWFYYYVYTLERYESFLEVAVGKQEKEPAWYNQMVEVLAGFQNPEGAWGAAANDQSNASAEISTCFSVLFLIRSTKKAIGDIGQGVLAGGWKLPDDTSEIRVEGTQIKGTAAAAAVTDLLGMLEGEDPNSIEQNSVPENLKLAADPEERRKQISRLERLSRGSESYMARRVATRLLGQSDDLKVVPTLIFALTDGDPIVRTYARDGLRFISRKFNGPGVPQTATQLEARKIADIWRKWYNDLDPGYVFLD